MVRIALNELGGKDWTGGLTYRNNLKKALETLPEKPELYLISQTDQVESYGYIIVKPYVSTNRIVKIYDTFSRHVLRTDYLLRRSLTNYDIDILFPGKMSAGRKTASIYWIPDFQFLHLPHFYQPGQADRIKANLPRYFRDASLIIVSSFDARSDMETYFPRFLDKTRVVSFVAHVPENTYLTNPREVADIYHLPDDFIYLPNQFWAHKNHLLVIEALGLLKREGLRPVIVSTGNPADSRNPLYFADIMRRVSECDLRNQFIVLGLVPHEHIYSLIRRSKCVLNPSLFEGWSTTVEEAKSVGKRMILSDLQVHKEQDPPGSVYFKRDNAVDLAEKLKDCWDNYNSGPDSELEKKARQLLSDRMRSFAGNFMTVCEEAIKKNK